jgi:hypothetical protein
MTQNTLLIATTMLLAMACGPDKAAVEKAEKEVFALHDAVMPLTMGAFPKLQDQLNARLIALDSLKNAGVASQVQLGEEREQIAQIRRQLSLADSSMNSWMENYKGDTLEKLNTADALRYLDQEKQTMTIIKQRTDNAMTAAKAYLTNQ